MVTVQFSMFALLDGTTKNLAGTFCVARPVIHELGLPVLFLDALWVLTYFFVSLDPLETVVLLQ